MKCYYSNKTRSAKTANPCFSSLQKNIRAMSHLLLVCTSLLLLLAEATAATCENTLCPRFYNAVCKDDQCQVPPCPPHFFFRGKDVTNKCPIDRCSNKTCNSKRTCVEIVKPARCPSNRPHCRQILKAKCILRNKPPKNCSGLVCGKESACRVQTRGMCPPVVRCIPTSRLRSCDNVHCDPGFNCTQDGPTVKCQAATTPQDERQMTTSCSELQCLPNQRCIESSKYTQSVCINATTGLTCGELQCPSDAPECLITQIPDFNNSILTSCTPIELISSIERALESSSIYNCTELGVICESQGLACTDLSEGRGRSTTIFCTRLNCSNTDESKSCPANSKCMDVPTGLAEDVSIQTACVPINATDIAFGINCISGWASTCRKGTTCIDTVTEGLSGAYCVPGTSPFIPCSEKTCPDNYICTEASFGSRPDLRFSTCTPEAEQILNTIKLLQGSRPNNQSTRATCGEVGCRDNERCITDPASGNSICVEATFGRTCNELRCPSSASLCSLNKAPSLGNITTALCVEKESLASLRSARQIIENSTCGTYRDLCESLDMACIDKRQCGQNAGFFCSLLNCTYDEECLFDNVCTELHQDVADIFNVDHACMPPAATNVSFGTTCTARIIPCDAGTVCTEATSIDIVSSFCTVEKLPTLPCSKFDCPNGKICVEATIGSEYFSYCADETFKNIVRFIHGRKLLDTSI